ncbi:hypothetical protein QYF61_010218 [Mycteria americana]|uniref:Uncharacterized protein n=1 Tax=Mycteria americana TaxID=33587 RepID=A0AAN7PIA8_MYCAM|nr:hypothetical protein QYF61_010218 [Mycteria americana]
MAGRDEGSVFEALVVEYSFLAKQVVLKVKQIPSKQRVKRLLVLSGERSSSKHPMEARRKAHSSPLLPHACRTRAARRGMAQPCLVQVSLEGPAVPEGLHRSEVQSARKVVPHSTFHDSRYHKEVEKQREARAAVINCSSVLTAQCHVSLLGVLEDGKSAQTGVTTASATAGMLNTEKRNNGGPQCANPMVHGAGATTQRQNGFRAAEFSTRCPVRVAAAELLQVKATQTLRLVYCFLRFSDGKTSQHAWNSLYCLKLSQSKWDAQKMSTKEVTINVTKSIRQSDRRKTKNCVAYAYYPELKAILLLMTKLMAKPVFVNTAKRCRTCMWGVRGLSQQQTVQREDSSHILEPGLWKAAVA